MGAKAYMFLALVVVGCTIRMAPGLEERADEPSAAYGSAAAAGDGRADVFASDSDPGGNGHGQVELDRGPGGHFFATIKINGTPVKFIVDTGAYKVMLTPQDAVRIGLPQGAYTERGIGVGGEVRLMPVTLDRVDIGPIRIPHVNAVVSEQPEDISLLGQNLLARLDSVEIRGNTMILSN